jgi:hypothetical protein
LIERTYRTSNTKSKIPNKLGNAAATATRECDSIGVDIPVAVVVGVGKDIINGIGLSLICMDLRIILFPDSSISTENKSHISHLHNKINPHQTSDRRTTRVTHLLCTISRSRYGVFEVVSSISHAQTLKIQPIKIELLEIERFPKKCHAIFSSNLKHSEGYLECSIFLRGRPWIFCCIRLDFRGSGGRWRDL